MLSNIRCQVRGAHMVAIGAQKPTSNERMLVILFSELAGHTVKTFYEKAEHNGWLQGPPGSPGPDQTPVYQFSPDQIFLQNGQ